ncbi:MAG: ribosome-associated translation inhibitor RaiA [Pseudonocardia sp.]|nr:ribosome-associated translation inhibitor RaiA [Pseudonocardia sp.]
MEIVITGRNVEVPDHFRVHVADKIARLERYDHKIMGMEVELFHERNRRQAKSCQRVEITGRGCGPIARAEACGPDFYAALDIAIGKLESRLRRAHDRRRVTYGRRAPGSLRTMNGVDVALLETSAVGDQGSVEDQHSLDEQNLIAAMGFPTIPRPRAASEDIATAEDIATTEDGTEDTGAGDFETAEFNRHLPGRVVREKEHTSKPMSVDQALSEMELVGYDFYLFSCVDTGQPSVVYRRKGYDYGVIRLT